MKKGYLTVVLVLILAILLSVPVLGAGDRHWVYYELAEFKQHLLQFQHAISREEWASVHAVVLNETKLDEPIQISHWSSLLKMILDPDQGKSGPMLDMYVYGLADGDQISRENAVGGMVKLLTLKYLSGSSTAEELKASQELKDLAGISDRQRVLVQKAYCEGLLDTQTKGEFRPQEDLTNAEAVSILNRVVNKYLISSQKPEEKIAVEHWYLRDINLFISTLKEEEKSFIITKEITANKMLDKPIQVNNWNELLMNTLSLPNSKYEKNFLESYTYGLADKNHLRRDKAVAGMMKLLHASEYVKVRDATPLELEIARQNFRDATKAFDQSKLAIAYSEGLIKGYEDGSFRPDSLLTNAEALVLLGRIKNGLLTTIK